MQSIFFTTIRGSVNAFKADDQSELDEADQKAWRLLHDSGKTEGVLGFRKERAAKSPNEIKNHLAEHGLNISDDSAERLAKRSARSNDKALVRQRFWVQVVISMIIVIAALLVLSFGGASETTEKAFFGLLGTVLGYWLR